MTLCVTTIHRPSVLRVHKASDGKKIIDLVAASELKALEVEALELAAPEVETSEFEARRSKLRRSKLGA